MTEKNNKMDIKFWAMFLGVVGAIISNFIKPAVDLGTWKSDFAQLKSAYADTAADYKSFKYDYQNERITLAGRLSKIETLLERIDKKV